MLYFALFASLICVSTALCPNSCNGNGICAQDDKCICHDNYQGVDCGARTCAFSKAFAYQIPSTGTRSHYYLECGGKGFCDRNSGICQCFEGYSGKGCKRSDCQNNCNGNGVCQTLQAVGAATTADWDHDKTRLCVCDPGYSGYDCADRKCPVGDDALTVGETAEVQTLTLQKDGGETDLIGEFTISYTDWRGETWTTWRIDALLCTDISIKEALVGLPNHAIPSVTVAADANNDNEERIFTITFSDPENTGDQPALVINTGGCTSSGCHPVYTALTGTAAVAETTKGTTESAECSNRGHCNTDSGTCECVPGYYGQSCEHQTVVV